MPKEIVDENAFIQISDRAEYCDIKRLKRTVKLKLKTSRKMYTLKTDLMKAEEILKKLHCEIREI